MRRFALFVVVVARGGRLVGCRRGDDGFGGGLARGRAVDRAQPGELGHEFVVLLEGYPDRLDPRLRLALPLEHGVESLVRKGVSKSDSFVS